MSPSVKPYVVGTVLMVLSLAVGFSVVVSTLIGTETPVAAWLLGAAILGALILLGWLNKDNQGHTIPRVDVQEIIKILNESPASNPDVLTMLIKGTPTDFQRTLRLTNIPEKDISNLVNSALARDVPTLRRILTNAEDFVVGTKSAKEIHKWRETWDI